MADGEEVIVRSSSRFNHYLLLKILVISLCFNAILATLFSWRIIYPEQAQYYATTIDGQSTPLVPLYQANMPPATLLQWASLAAVAANTYDYYHYNQQINALAKYFTTDGWTQFYGVWQSSQNLSDLIKSKLYVTAVTRGAPVIVAQGIINGIYTWEVQIPVLVNYQSASQVRRQPILVSMIIERVATVRSGRGIGITAFNVSG